jgi:hypothetical protein
LSSITPACDICSNSEFSCSHNGGLESLDLRIDSQLEDGCHASLIGVSHTSPLRIICEPPQLCKSSGSCDSADFDHNTIVIGDYTCNAR